MTAQAGRGQEKGIKCIKDRRCHGPSGPMQRDTNKRRQTNKHTHTYTYMGRTRDGGLLKLREELEAVNSGVHIPAEIRWLGGAKVRARFQVTASSSH